MSNIRNFSIIAHIDHGKSTLADRMLEITKTVEDRKMREQYLDQMPLERERGITIKMQPVRMEWKNYILNLIDTPGHIDFSYEVSRALAAVEGAVLLVDATQGVQAQTISNVELARSLNLKIIPVINKIDLLYARINETTDEIKNILGDTEIFQVSARTGEGVQDLLDKIIEKVPPPNISDEKKARALIFDFDYSLFPERQDDFEELRRSLERLKLSDASLSFEEESSGVLGRGFRCGFLGMLHLEIVV